MDGIPEDWDAIIDQVNALHRLDLSLQQCHRLPALQNAGNLTHTRWFLRSGAIADSTQTQRIKRTEPHPIRPT
jgi:hypothetical protein